MNWLELKNLGRLYGFVAHARTFRGGGTNVGALEFSKREDLERAKAALDGQMIEGGRYPLRVRHGVPVDALRPRAASGFRPRGNTAPTHHDFGRY